MPKFRGLQGCVPGWEGLVWAIRMTQGSGTGLIENLLGGKETKLFDPMDSSPGKGTELLDASVVRRGNRWWMYLAGQAGGYGATQLFSASLDAGEPLSVDGWKLSRNEAGDLAPLAAQSMSRVWDGSGGRHCPSHVRGWDPRKQAWVERIYYAGAAESLWGPYTIGFLEWNGEAWIDQPTPAFAANKTWEHGSVYEPNLIYHDGNWKMWYVAGGRTRKITWCRAMLRATTELPDGAHTLSSPYPK
jgi:hypothetical protein